jgi:hypothetical protein
MLQMAILVKLLGKSLVVLRLSQVIREIGHQGYRWKIRVASDGT